jgi:hypothetical protein
MGGRRVSRHDFEDSGFRVLCWRATPSHLRSRRIGIQR